MTRWQSVSPYPDAAPEAEQTVNGALIHRTNGRRNCFGRWISQAERAAEGKHYRFTVRCLPLNVRDAFANVHALLTWRNAGGCFLQRDYIDRRQTPDGLVFDRVLPAPGGTASVQAELCFKWSDTGQVTWSCAAISEVPSVLPKTCRVVSAFTTLPGGKENNLRAVLDVIDRAAAANPDILCLGETQLTPNVPFFESAVTVDGPEVALLCGKAKLYNMYIIMGLSLLEEGLYRNAAVLIGCGGNVEGVYRKVHLPLAEAEWGYTPGDDYCVFDTDFGKIGILICWDQSFPEAARRLTERGASVLFIPTYGNSPLQARARASDNGVFVAVSATRWGGDFPCYIIDPFGDLIASCEGGEARAFGFCAADLDLSRQYKTIWYSVGDCYGEHGPVLANEYRVDLHNKDRGNASE